MFRVFSHTLVCLFLSANLVGCGSDARVADPAPTEVSYDFVKTVLQSAIESGEIGSASQEIHDGLGAMVEGGDSRAQEILDDFVEVEKAEGNPGTLKKKAKALIDKL